MNSHCRLHPASEGVVEGDDFVGIPGKRESTLQEEQPCPILQ